MARSERRSVTLASHEKHFDEIESKWRDDSLAMTCHVTLIEHDEGVSVSCPALKGCHSQGRTRDEALENIREAIREWLAAEAEEAKLFKVTKAEVTV